MYMANMISILKGQNIFYTQFRNMLTKESIASNDRCKYYASEDLISLEGYI